MKLFFQCKDVFDHCPHIGFRYGRMGCHRDSAPYAAASGNDLFDEAVDGGICGGAVFAGYFVISWSYRGAAGSLIETVTGGAIAGSDQLQAFIIG